jgi:glucan biosynthesis protein
VSFGKEPPSRFAGARVRAFRTGVPGAGFRPVTDGSHLFVVDWAGGDVASLGDLETKIDVRGGTLVEARTEKHADDGSWRTAFQVRPQATDVELRGFLHAGDRAASETLAYLWQPGKEVAAR